MKLGGTEFAQYDMYTNSLMTVKQTGKLCKKKLDITRTFTLANLTFSNFKSMVLLPSVFIFAINVMRITSVHFISHNFLLFASYSF